MKKIRIIKKNDDYSSEYDIGDIFNVEGTWYGGVHILGKTGVPISLDNDEYTVLSTEPEGEPIADDGGRGCLKKRRSIYIKCSLLHSIRKPENAL